MHRVLRTRIGAWENPSDEQTKFIVHTALANPAKLSRLARQRKGQPRHHSELSMTIHSTPAESNPSTRPKRRVRLKEKTTDLGGSSPLRPKWDLFSRR